MPNDYDAPNTVLLWRPHHANGLEALAESRICRYLAPPGLFFLLLPRFARSTLMELCAPDAFCTML
jgi:hypothetical protein